MHENFIKETFELYTLIDYHTWIKVQTTDNAVINKKVAKLLNIIHIPCKNYLLDSEVKQITDNYLSSEKCQNLVKK